MFCYFVKKMKKIVFAIIILTGMLCLNNDLYGFEGKKTHPTLTREAINSSAAQIDNYLKTQLGFSGGLSSELYWDFPADIKERINKGEAGPDITTRSILGWLQAGSTIEDENIEKIPQRRRHHFHDPYRNTGLDNHYDHPDWNARGWPSWLPLGVSALDWAIDGFSIYTPYSNEEQWSKARDAFYNALRLPSRNAKNTLLLLFWIWDVSCI
jgi:hypothetical protein